MPLQVLTDSAVYGNFRYDSTFVTYVIVCYCYKLISDFKMLIVFLVLLFVLRQIESDLLPWRDGITRDLLGRADTRATTYQIINHKVYREKKCVFEARLAGDLLYYT